MPAGVGETLLTTLFADCHYYFSDPSSKPPHHRFDRGSYVYLFYNSSTRQAKIEVANNAGTAEQDAFHGYLNVANVAYSHLQPTLCTLFINTGAVQDPLTWHLPTLDPRNEQKYSYKLHAMDIYLWTEKDASTFLGHLKSVLGADKFDIKHAPATAATSTVGSPHSEHRDSMSPVVQLLEKTAVGTHFPPRAPSAVSAHSFPGPPTPAASGGASPKPMPAPMAYNPAAPPAPEPVQYREKTPPPIDDGTGTGLANAAKYDSVPQQQNQYGQVPGIIYQNTTQPSYFSGGPQQHQHQPRQSSMTSFPGPPPQSSSSAENIPRTFSGSVPPPPSQQQQRAPSFGPMAQSTLPQSPPPGQQSLHRQSVTPQAQQHAVYTPGPPQLANHPASPGFQAPPAYGGGGGTPLQSPGFPGPPPPQLQNQIPVGGYSNYSYSSSSQTGQVGEYNSSSGGYQGDIHSQVWRPTEAEAQAHAEQNGNRDRRENGGSSGKAGKVEGNVNRYLKKLDKLW